MHVLLARQLRRLGIDPTRAPQDDETWGRLLERVSSAYTASDQERYLLGRSITISTRELRELNERHATREAEQAALRRVATAVAAGVGRVDLLDLVAEEAARLLDADAGRVIQFCRTQGLGAVVGHWANDEGVPGAPEAGRPGSPREFVLDEGTAAGRVFHRGQPARVDGYRPGDASHSGHLVRQGYRSGVAAPITVDGAVWGAVAVVSRNLDGLPATWRSSLEGFAELAGMAIANAQARAELSALATTDSLTGLANHRSFLATLGAAASSVGLVSLVLFDVDRFKRVNDVHGHLVGDDVLVEVAHRLSTVVREGDLLGRVGGEEFGLLLPGTGASEAAGVADRARRAVAVSPIGVAGRITVSGGVCTLDDATRSRDLYRCADQALYEAKAGGRDRVVAYRSETEPAVDAPSRA